MSNEWMFAWKEEEAVVIRLTKTSVTLLTIPPLSSPSCCFFGSLPNQRRQKPDLLQLRLKWKKTEEALAGFFSSASFPQSVLFFFFFIHRSLFRGRKMKTYVCVSVDLWLCYSTTVDTSVSCCLPFSFFFFFFYFLPYLSAVTPFHFLHLSVPLISGVPQEVLSQSSCVCVCVCVFVCVCVRACHRVSAQAAFAILQIDAHVGIRSYLWGSSLTWSVLQPLARAFCDDNLDRNHTFKKQSLKMPPPEKKNPLFKV